MIRITVDAADLASPQIGIGIGDKAIVKVGDDITTTVTVDEARAIADAWRRIWHDVMLRKSVAP